MTYVTQRIGQMDFLELDPRFEDYWRSIVLFGQNVATYKFALAKSLIELGPSNNGLIRLEELAEPFSRHIVEHIATGNRQGTFQSSRFLDACEAYSRGELEKDELVRKTVQIGFNNVIDAFHIVARSEVAQRFFIDERRTRGGIVVTDNLFRLLEGTQSSNLGHEAEARWRLVETAWSMGLPPSLLQVESDASFEQLFVKTPGRRVSVTAARDALNGYQKGACFYCYDAISVDPPSSNLADVDHFFPHTLRQGAFQASLDGVWNLVLACRECNRGAGGKFDRIPSLKLLKRLAKRNEYLISSHHPLRETLKRHTGEKPASRQDFLQSVYNEAKSLLPFTWEPEPKGPEVF